MASDALFLSAVKKLTERNLALVEMIGIADALRAAGDISLVLQLYKLWLNFNQDNPLRYVAYFNCAVTLSSSGEWIAAKEALEHAVAVNPDFFPAYINLGNIHETLGSLEGAVAQWTTIVDRLAPITGAAIRFKTTGLKQIARVLQTKQQSASAERILRQSLEIDENQRDVAQHYVALRLAQCEWPVISPWEGVSRNALMMGVGPLSMSVYTDDPMLQLAAAWNYNRQPSVGGGATARPQLKPRAAEPAPHSGRRRIGYVSSDLRAHAIGYLMAEIFGLHDRSKVEVFAYYCGIPNDDATKTRIKGAVDHWIDITGMNDDAAAARIAADGIDILIDVNGYTRDARTAVFGRYPAPINVNWLGYPGSMGSPSHHYIIADDWIIPPDHELYYTEKVVRLPCYQPNDRKRVIAADRPSRQDAKLPDDAMVYCCFNGLQKVSRFTFERWMTILQRVPNSVLWLLAGSEETHKRLADFAVQHGVAADRLIFAEKLGNPSHLARYPLADLFLDTAPYGAHTTASDALWMGVPILTLSGRGFASRVCGSLARSAGLPDMVCSTPDEYIERAVALGNDRAQIQRLKERLTGTRDTCVLFDMDSLVRHLEALYGQMWADYQQGRLPRPDLTNLDVYLEVGIEDDHEAVEVQTIKDYHAWYKAKLARRHQVLPIGPDRRLWTAADIAATNGAAEAPVDTPRLRVLK